MDILIDLEKIKKRKYTEENGFKMSETVDFVKSVYICGWNDAIDAVCKITPSKERRGRWVYDDYLGRYCCSICGHRPFLKTCYCSTCGAEMGVE